MHLLSMEPAAFHGDKPKQMQHYLFSEHFEKSYGEALAHSDVKVYHMI